MTIKIINTEIIDNTDCTERCEGYQISEISIEVTVEISDETTTFQFQTSDVCDYGTFNHNLTMYINNDFIDDDTAKVLKNNESDLLKNSNAQKMWDEYILENFDWDPQPAGFSFLGANSEYMWATKK